MSHPLMFYVFSSEVTLAEVLDEGPIDVAAVGVFLDEETEVPYRLHLFEVSIRGQTSKGEWIAKNKRYVYRSVTPVTTFTRETYSSQVLALTRHFAKLSISPESSDGFASVGTILPKEKATLLPGGLFAFSVRLLWDSGGEFPKRKPMKKD